MPGACSSSDGAPISLGQRSRSCGLCPCLCLGAGTQHTPGRIHAPTAPMWQGQGGLWDSSHCLASHMSAAETWQALETFFLFFSSPCINPQKLQHWHLKCLSGERRGVKPMAPRRGFCLSCPLLIPAIIERGRKQDVAKTK